MLDETTPYLNHRQIDTDKYELLKSVNWKKNRIEWPYNLWPNQQ